MSQCRNCLVTERVPGVQIENDAVCNLCHSYSKQDLVRIRSGRERLERELEQILRTTRGKGDYDCLVCLSGGKDSLYLLYKLKVEYKLRVLAYTTNVNIPDIAWQNIHNSVKKLSAEHIVYTPPEDFYLKLYRYLLQNQEERGAVRTVCYVCAPLSEGFALKLAVEKQIPLIFAGYSPGQPDPERLVFEFSPKLIRETDWTPAEIKESGLFTSDELKLFWNPALYPAGTEFPRFIAPFHAWEYSQEETMRTVVKLGLAVSKSAASPIHSNCPLNWLLMYSDLKNLGFNPYLPEFSKLIREGKASRLRWRLAAPIVNWMIRKKIFLGKEVRRSFSRLSLTEEQLKIVKKV